jgi:putative methionine-R-sulfoxide reductase with GAF domain
MPENHEKLLADLQEIQSLSQERNVALGKVAALLRGYGGYRWVGLYDVYYAAGLVKNVVWSGSGAPEFPTFPITKGLTSLAIQTRRVVNVGDVSSDPRYLTAFGSTRSEIIVPILDRSGDRVVGTIDVESEQRNAFSAEIEELLKACEEVISPLWGGKSPNAG